LLHRLAHAELEGSMLRTIPAAVAATLACLSTLAVAQQLIVYPARGQSPQQQQQDEAQCRSWATQNTGIDPAILAATPVGGPSGPAIGGGERLAGAARGAVGGLAIGAIAGDAGQGAGIGAVAGTMAGGRQARQNRSGQQQQAQSQRQQQLDTWNRAVGACLEARGYTVR
jgi:hypothetical protein